MERPTNAFGRARSIDNLGGDLGARVLSIVLSLGIIALLSAALATEGSKAASSGTGTGGWRATGSLRSARFGHSATRLFGGNVLVGGGVGRGGSPLASAELYDVGKRRWRRTASLSTARSLHTATLLSGIPRLCGLVCSQVVVAGGSGADGKPLVSAELYDPATRAWKQIRPLFTARSSHTATLLGNGKILVTGGMGPDGRPLASAELYDAKADAWSQTGSLATARTSHTAALLSNGKVLVAGGRGPDGRPLASAELYDPMAGTWSPTGSLSTARASHTATPLGDATSGKSDTRVLVAGGTTAGGKPTRTAELFNPDTGRWRKTGALQGFHSKHTAGVLPDGKVLVAGGDTTKSEVYDPGRGSWRSAPSLAGRRGFQTASVLNTGQVLVAGGAERGPRAVRSAAVYSPSLTHAGSRAGRHARSGWAPTDSLRHARSAHTATLLGNGKVLVVGGQTSLDLLREPAPFFFGRPADACCAVTPLRSVELYSPAKGRWSNGRPLRDARSFHTATLLRGSRAQCGKNCGKVIVAGGIGGGPSRFGHLRTLASAELYDPTTGRWKSTAPMLEPRAMHTATLLQNGKVLVVAGGNDAGASPVFPVATAEIYDPATETWTKTGSLTGATEKGDAIRVGHRAALLRDGRVLVTGGTGCCSPSVAAAELYDPTKGTWSPATSMFQSREVHSSTLLPNGKLLVTGGFHSPFLPAPPHLDVGELYDAANDRWQATSFLRSRRIYQTDTLLPGGRVLLTGGVAGGNAPSFPNAPGPALFSAELFDSATGRFSLTPYMNTGRVLQTATLLPRGPRRRCASNCGKVLVVGGDREMIGNFIPYQKYANPLRSAELYTPTR